jgi:hypothetical protein
MVVLLITRCCVPELHSGSTFGSEKWDTTGPRQTKVQDSTSTDLGRCQKQLVRDAETQ